VAAEELGRFAEWLIKKKARELIGKAGLTASDRADLEQELRFDLSLRLRRYDPKRLPRHVFVSSIISNKTAAILKHERAQLRDRRREARSLNEALPDQDDGQETAFGDTFDSEVGRDGLSPEELRQLKTDLAAVTKGLSDRQRWLIELLLEDPNVRRAARKLGIHHTTAYEDIKQIHDRFEKANLREYLRNRPTHRGRKKY